MSLHHVVAGLAVMAALISNAGCCHKHHGCCSNACTSCYSSPASRTEPPQFVPVPSQNPAQR